MLLTIGQVAHTQPVSVSAAADQRRLALLIVDRIILKGQIEIQRVAKNTIWSQKSCRPIIAIYN